MHIPDNYLSPSTCAVMGAVMIPLWGRAVKKVKTEVTKKKMPLMGIGAALSFLTMMFNIPLPGGTSGHAVGGTLLAILLGPEAAFISISIALLIQALLFGDGGILAFTANSFNMAFVMPFAGFYIYNFLKKGLKSGKGEKISAFLASYIAINIAALLVAIELGLQPLLFKDAAGMPLYNPYPFYITIPSMLIPHLVFVGLLEGVITVGVLSFIRKVSPEIIYEGSSKKMRPIYALLIALIFLSPLGLLAPGTAFGEWGTSEIASVTAGGKTLGFVPTGIKNGFSFNSMMSRYSIKGLSSIAGYILSAVAGVAILLIVFRIIASTREER